MKRSRGSNAVPDRWMGPLHRGWAQLRQTQRKIFALEVEGGCAPGPRHHITSFGPALARIVAAEAIADELVLVEDAAASDADVKPALAQIVEQRELRGQPHGMAQRHLNDGKADADALGAHCQCRRKRDRVRIDALAG